MKLGYRFVENQQIKLPVQTVFLDPLERIREVKLEYWTGPPGPPRPATKKAPSPVEGDAQRQTVAANYKQGVATNDLLLPTLPAGQVYWLQTTFVTKSGVKHWGPATSFTPSGDPPLERIAVDLTVNSETQLRTMKVTSKNELQVAKGKEKFVEGFVMEMQFLEMITKTDKGSLVKLVPGKGGFFMVDQGKKRAARRHCPGRRGAQRL